MLGIGTPELIVCLVVVLLLFGGAKIPELLRGVGKGIGEFQKARDEAMRTLRSGMDE